MNNCYGPEPKLFIRIVRFHITVAFLLKKYLKAIWHFSNETTHRRQFPLLVKMALFTPSRCVTLAWKFRVWKSRKSTSSSTLLLYHRSLTTGDRDLLDSLCINSIVQRCQVYGANTIPARTNSQCIIIRRFLYYKNCLAEQCKLSSTREIVSIR